MKMPQFRYDPAQGSFKHWLFRIVRRRVADHFRRLYRQAAHVNMDPRQPRGAEVFASSQSGIRVGSPLGGGHGLGFGRSESPAPADRVTDTMGETQLERDAGRRVQAPALAVDECRFYF